MFPGQSTQSVAVQLKDARAGSLAAGEEARTDNRVKLGLNEIAKELFLLQRV